MPELCFGRGSYLDQQNSSTVLLGLFLLFGYVLEGLFRIELALHVMDNVIVTQLNPVLQLLPRGRVSLTGLEQNRGRVAVGGFLSWQIRQVSISL